MGKPKPSRPQNVDARRNPPKSDVGEQVRLSFEFYEPGGTFCLSHSTREEVRQFTDCLRKLTSLTWQDLRAQSGRPGNKVGLAYTAYDDGLLRTPRPSNLSPELRIVGVRASQKTRLFGVKDRDTFYVVWFDRGHDVVAG